MINVGISRVHNSAVSLLRDGDIVFHIENERLSNIKYDAFPFHALSKLPDYTNGVDNLCIAGVGATVPCENYTNDNIYTAFVKNLNRQFKDKPMASHDLWDNHHLLHASCAFYNSGFSEALCIIKDGMGSEFPINDPRFHQGTYGRENSSTFTASYPSKFQLIDKEVIVGFPCDASVGNVNITNKASEALTFQKTSKLFGFEELDAGKVMGMASYGKEESHQTLDSVKFVNQNLHTGYIDATIKDDFQSKADFAYSLQKQSQEQVKKYILDMVEKTGIKNVCLSGGFFLNCVANYYYLEDLPSDIKIYIEPISSDAGTSIGAAKLIWHLQSEDMTIRKQSSIYYGFKYNYYERQILDKLEGETYERVKYEDVAKLISEKNIVAMYQGRSEAGPRALGNRSILYDPRDPNGKDFVNTVKHREWFRPFAGSILHEETNKWFDMRGLEESPFMMYAVNVLQPEKIPAITHIDGTCRVQTVKPEQNTHYYNLISAFNDITGVPILFNTSFNLAGDCIVETIDDALRTIRNSDIKYLYLPEFSLLVKKPS
jgi:carbamoyltransferase